MTLTLVATASRPTEYILIEDSSDDETPRPPVAPARSSAPDQSNSNGIEEGLGDPPAKRLKTGSSGVPVFAITKHLQPCITYPATATATATTPIPTPTPKATASLPPSRENLSTPLPQFISPPVYNISDDDEDGSAPTPTGQIRTPSEPQARPDSLPRESGSRPSLQRGPYRLREATLAPPAPRVRPPPSQPPQSPQTRTPKTENRIPPTSPANYRARSHARQLQTVTDAVPRSSVKWPVGRRPYLRRTVRAQLARGSKRLLGDYIKDDGPVFVHADFTADEVETVVRFVAPQMGVDDLVAVAKQYNKAAKKDERQIRRLAGIDLPGRKPVDVINFLADVGKYRRWDQIPQEVALERDILDQENRQARNARFFSLLGARAKLPLGTATLLGTDAVYTDTRNGLKCVVEDELELRLEWTNASGDIVTTSWLSDDAFMCGATSHSDAHNQQYNRAGNLLLGSASQKTVRAYPDHRILRPIVDKGSNASEEMRESQEPWLYSSVVFSDYDGRNDRVFTASFDHTVKVWDLTGDGLRLLGTWKHTGNVNYVLASKHPSGMVATAANAAADAVRIYSVDEDDVSASSYRPFSAPIAEGAATEKWAYFPSTIRWGLAPPTDASTGSLHLLLAGYSPRSLTEDENEIPEEKRQSGELRLWDGLSGESWTVSSASKCNVFDVAWHPSAECFIAATSPAGNKESSTRTQIRIYGRSRDLRNTYSEKKILDCTAMDVNSLAIMPYCPKWSYVTAGCTDGKTYVWDTGSQEAAPFQILAHDAPLDLDPKLCNLETEDVGVQFQAWGSSLDRFYTGSSDGTIRVWNVRSEGKPLVRVLVECPGAITSGAFSPDKTKLVVGDATGRVFLLTTHDFEEDEWGGSSSSSSSSGSNEVGDCSPQPPTTTSQPATKIPGPSSAQPGQLIKIPTEDGGTVTRRRPIPILLHPEPPKPTHDAVGNPIELVGPSDCARAFIKAGQLVIHPSRVIGAVQGPNYGSTGLFCLSSRTNPADWRSPLKAAEAARQQFALWQYSGVLPPRSVAGGNGGGVRERDEGARAKAMARHFWNLSLDLDVDALDEETKAQLGKDAVVLAKEPDFDFAYGELPEEDGDENED